MRRKKVLFLITKSTWGGAQRYVFDLATNIDKDVYDPVIALGGKDELYDRLREAGLRVISVKGLGRDVSVFKDLLASFRIGYLIVKERPNVLHVNSSKVGVLGTLLGRTLFLEKVVFTCHGWAFNESRPGWQKLIIKFLQWLTVLLSHTTITVSNGVKKDMNWPLVQRKMKVVHLGRNVSVLKDKRDSREILSMKVTDKESSLYEHIDDTWLGTVAELHPTKNLNVAIEAVAQLKTDFPALRYIIIHDGQERPRLERLVDDLDLNDHVFILGTIPDAAKLISALDLFVLPSKSEAFGYVLLEAGNAGLPVIASNVGGIPDIITDKENGLLVPPGDVDALVAAVKDLLNDEAAMAAFGKALQQKTQSFTVEKMVEKTELIYEN